MAFFMKIKFWLLVGLILFLSAVSYFTLAAPLRAKNKQALQKLDQRAKSLQRYANQPDLKNKSWIEQISKQKEQAQKEVQKVYDLLAKRDEQLERGFADKEGKPITDAGLWLDEYKRRMTALRKQIQDSGCRLTNPQTALVEKQFGNLLPTKAQMKQQEKEYWLQQGMVQVITELHKQQGKIVPVFYGFEFAKKGGYRLAHVAHKAPKYQSIHCQLKVAMEFRETPTLLRALLNSPVGFQIEKVDIDRQLDNLQAAASRTPAAPATYGPQPAAGGPEYGAPPGRGGAAAPRQPETGEKRIVTAEALQTETLVRVIILFYVPDYLNPEDAPKRRPRPSF